MVTMSLIPNGAAVRRLRHSLGMTQSKFAQEIGVKRNVVTNMEVGNNGVPKHILPKLIELGIDRFTSEGSYEEPIRVRATRRQLKVLIGILFQDNMPLELRENARQELFAALDLNSS
jgi:DNA-binding XRE family transcriptional regulator